jgi:outer membrane scaffolding protein for murein synthesis (MipA/OmpV family)
MNRLPLLLLPLALAAAPAFAQDQAAGPADPNAPDLGKDSVTIGIAGVYMPDYEGSNDYRIFPAPGALVSVHGFNLTLAGDRASVDLIPNKPGPTWDVQAGPIAVLDFNRSTPSQIGDARIRALGKRASTLEIGGFVGIGKTGVITSPYDKLSVTVSYRKGVNAAHGAGIFSPSLNYFTPLSHKAAVGLIASAEYAERGYAHAYFDVDAAQSARSGLPVYTTQGGWKSFTVGLIGTRSITGDLLHGFKLVGGITYKRLLNDFADSPVVSIAGSKSQVQAIGGLAYTF